MNILLFDIFESATLLESMAPSRTKVADTEKCWFASVPKPNRLSTQSRINTIVS
jgi:hypothetical protein